jgi:dihydroneopterin aldolase
MGIIKINNIQLYAYHGCLEEEAKIGSPYIVDVTVKSSFKKAAQTDDLMDAVDYVHLNRIVKEEMAVRSDLLEHVARRILDRMITELPLVKKATIRVAKINPPIGGSASDVSIIMSKKQEKRKK